ncbi:hypothetical protein [Membranihabitans maritimus]|nr:hypothetical protein [Membranihabitans maritimus]
MDHIKNQGKKGRFVMWIIIVFILLVLLFTWIYKMNMHDVPA